MNNNIDDTRARSLKQDAEAHKAEIDLLAETYDESTPASWFWAFICGPLYYLAHGFWQRALIIFVLNFVVIGFFLSPFLAYPAWKIRAKEKAEKMLLVDAARRR